MNLSSLCLQFIGLLFVCSTVSCNDPHRTGTDHDSSKTVTLPTRQAQLTATREDATELANSDSAAVASATESGQHDWPRFLGKNFDGVADSAGIRLDWSSRPAVAWKLAVGDGYGLGCIDQGRYFHADSIREGSQRLERLRAFDLNDGKVVWSVQRPLVYRDMLGYEAGPRGTPTTDGQSIITFGCDGELSCRDLVDGSLKWSVATNETYGVVQNFFGVGASPLLLDSKVIVPVGGSPTEDQGVAPGRLDRVISNGSALVAFDIQTGKPVWQGGDDLASYSSPRTMQIDSKTVVLYFARDHLLAVDPTDGKMLWKHHHRADILESVNAMMPIIDDGRIFISECYQVGSVLLKASLDDPTTIWQDPPKDRRSQAMRCHWSTPALVDGYLYGCSGRNNPDSDFRCVELATGNVQWSDDRRIRTSIARAGEHLIVLDERGKMQIIRPNRERLEIIAEYDFSTEIQWPCWAAPIVIGNRVLIRGDNNVLCLTIQKR